MAPNTTSSAGPAPANANHLNADVKALRGEEAHTAIRSMLSRIVPTDREGTVAHTLHDAFLRHAVEFQLDSNGSFTITMDTVRQGVPERNGDHAFGLITGKKFTVQKIVSGKVDFEAKKLTMDSGQGKGISARAMLFADIPLIGISQETEIPGHVVRMSFDTILLRNQPMTVDQVVHTFGKLHLK
eukprot:TRINITY_DN13718_c0_g1_i1.p1 TRINITY_DN13718_c0_g1~~TRINITY_DN13718_c0_g1_i1.p1  ORF type:complete len:194 (+),score=10.67 TRINITY_DN13718_c0_g1_i1:29-583(+)